MSNNDTLLEYYVALNWAREIVGNIDNGAATFQVTASDGQVSDGTLDIRECQLRMIEILENLVKFEGQQKKQRIYRIK